MEVCESTHMTYEMNISCRDLICLIDWKTSKKSRPLLKNTYDDPLQIAAYLGAVNADPNTRNQVTIQ